MDSLRAKIGQLLIIGFSGCEITENSAIFKALQEENIGGVLLFDYDFTNKSYGKNLKNVAQIKRLTADLKHFASHDREGKLHQPLFVAIDYEGGAVDRLSKIDGCMKTMSAEQLAKLPEGEFVSEVKKMAQTLKELGFNLNFAPVVDLNLNEKEGIIGKLGRSFSKDSRLVSRAAKDFITAFRDLGIVCAYKHFPGHGSASGDTHQGFVDVTDTFRSEELLPYQTLLKENIEPVMVMTAHVINRALDNTGLPATLSYPILTDLLRKELGFNGVIISDDLQMQAISDHYSLEESLAMTLNAGADMVIFGNQLGQHTAKEVIDCIEGLVKTGVVNATRIDESYQRIIRQKQMIPH